MQKHYKIETGWIILAILFSLWFVAFVYGIVSQLTEPSPMEIYRDQFCGEQGYYQNCTMNLLDNTTKWCRYDEYYCTNGTKIATEVEYKKVIK